MTEIIAEISGNHGGSLDKACDLIRAAADCGCGYAKFQLYRPEDLPDFDPKANYPVPESWLDVLFEIARRNQISLFASVFAPWAVTALGPFKPRFLKIASPESTRLPRESYSLIVERFHKWKFDGEGFPELLVSAPLHDPYWFAEIEYGVTVLLCKAGYPATLTEADLLTIQQEIGRGNAVGVSDHTAGIFDMGWFVAMGADLIEKHFKLSEDCVDTAFSLDPQQMKNLCRLADQY